MVWARVIVLSRVMLLAHVMVLARVMVLACVMAWAPEVRKTKSLCPKNKLITILLWLRPNRKARSKYTKIMLCTRCGRGRARVRWIERASWSQAAMAKCQLTSWEGKEERLCIWTNMKENWSQMKKLLFGNSLPHSIQILSAAKTSSNWHLLLIQNQRNGG